MTYAKSTAKHRPRSRCRTAREARMLQDVVRGAERRAQRKRRRDYREVASASVRDGGLAADQPVEALDQQQQVARIVEVLEAILGIRMNRAARRQLAVAGEDLAHPRDQHPLQPLRQRERVDAERLRAREQLLAWG